MEKFITGTDQHLLVHDKKDCSGNCPIHSPSPHHMKNWPLHWREDRSFFERIDKYGCGHPDPDNVEYLKKKGIDISIHGCNGECSPNNNKESA
jgi:hypothetical protein